MALLNKRYAPEHKAQLIEQLWRVAMADGKIDLQYVPHADFILAKHRVQTSGAC